MFAFFQTSEIATNENDIENLTKRRTRAMTRAKTIISAGTVSKKRSRNAMMAGISENVTAKLTQRETRASAQTATRAKATVTTDNVEKVKTSLFE